MVEETFVIPQATDGLSLQIIEKILNEINGVERVLIDTDDGEVKIEYDEEMVTHEKIVYHLHDYDLYD